MRVAAFSLVLACVAGPIAMASLAGEWTWLARGAFFAFLALFIITGALTAWDDRTEF